PSSVRLLIQLERNGNWVTEKDITINGKTTSQYLTSVILNNLPERPFNIRMVRETADSTTDQLQNRTLWSSYTEIIDVKQCYLGTGSQWSVSGPHIKPGKDFWFYVRSVNLVGKSAFVEASGRASNDAEGYLGLFREKIGKLHLAQGMWELIDNSQLDDEMAEMKTTITETRNEITQTVSKTLEDQSATIQQIQRVQTGTNHDLAALYMLKVQKTKNGIPYVAGIGAGIEDADGQPLSNILLQADRIAMINPENGNTTPLFVAQGNQLFMNDVFLKRLFAVSITSSGNPPTFSLTPEGRLTARNADISGHISANSGTLNNVTINQNCRILGKLSANQIEGDIVKTVGKAFPRDSRAPERWPSGTITVRIYDDQPFDRQIVIPAVAFSGAKHEREHNDIYSSCRLMVKCNGRVLFERTALAESQVYSGVIDMPAGRGHMTLEFSVSAWLKEKGAFDQPYWMMKASLLASMNKVITDVGPGKLNLGGCVIEVMGTYEAAIVRVTIGEYGATGFINGTVCTCTVYGDTRYFHWRVDYSTKNKPDTVSQRDASTTQKGVVQLSSDTDSNDETK
ncbi:DUF1983 domain-containing protein, partial [Escherichia coli]|nr:DUF1983 domain-containing protein [Escherichia coli]